MGKREQFILKEKELIVSQMQALNEHLTITEDPGMFQVLIDEERSAVARKEKDVNEIIVESTVHFLKEEELEFQNKSTK